MSEDIIVIGSGVIGSSIAYHLARDGARVTLIDKAFAAATRPAASWASAGGLRSQGRHAEDHPITKAAALRWKTLSQELDANLEASFGGHLHIAEKESEIPVIEARIASDSAAGLTTRRVEGKELREIAPALTNGAVAGAFSDGDGQAHPGRTAAAFTKAAARLGARTIFDREVRLNVAGRRIGSITLSDGSKLAACTIISAAGAWSIDLLAGIGMKLPMRWRGLQMLLSDMAVQNLLAPTVTAVGRNLSLKQAPSGEFMIGGRWFASPFPGKIETDCIDAHVARQWSGAAAILPALRSRRLAQAWSGVEAQTIDSLPFIGRTEIEGLYLATGFSNHGFQISPEIGALVAKDVLFGQERVLLPFATDRHQGLVSEKVDAFLAERLDC